MTTPPLRCRRRRKQAMVLGLALMSLPLQGCAELLLFAQLFSGIGGLISSGVNIYSAVQRMSGGSRPRTAPPSAGRRPALGGAGGVNSNRPKGRRPQGNRRNRQSQRSARTGTDGKRQRNSLSTISI
jgi:hypothetical protein